MSLDQPNWLLIALTVLWAVLAFIWLRRWIAGRNEPDEHEDTGGRNG